MRDPTRMIRVGKVPAAADLYAVLCPTPSRSAAIGSGHVGPDRRGSSTIGRWGSVVSIASMVLLTSVVVTLRRCNADCYRCRESASPNQNQLRPGNVKLDSAWAVP